MAGETTREDVDARPDPDRVHSAADLALHLDRLRRAAARGTRQRRVGLDQLAKATGIPRSTLHTYLSGATLPPASALDSLVIALGCGDDEVRAWAQAWDRAVDATHASRARTAVSPSSRLVAFCGDVQDKLERPADRAYDLVEYVSVFERFSLGADRSLAWLDLRATVRATADGVDRYAVRIGPKPSLDMDRLELTNLMNCSAGEHRTLTQPRVRVLEVLFDHALVAGETYVFELRIDYAAAADPDGAPAEPTTEALRGFLRRGPAFTMEARFRPDDHPVDLRQVHLGHVDGEENVVRPLRLNGWGATHIAVDQPAAGLHGIRWSWSPTVPAPRPGG